MQYNESKFNMWRACISIIHLDNKIDRSERKWAEGKIKNLPFTEEQKTILRSDLENGTPLEEIFPKISDKRDRAFLIYQIRVISHLDKDFSPEEKATLKKYEDAVLKGIDLVAIDKQIAEIEKESYHEDNIYKNNTGMASERLFNSLRRKLNPGDYANPMFSKK